MSFSKYPNTWNRPKNMSGYTYTPERKKRSGAKYANTKDGRGVSAWRKTRAGLFTFFFNPTKDGKTKNGHKTCVETKGKNGKVYRTSVPVVITHKDSFTTKTAWGLWDVQAQTLSINSLGIYICLKQGGFVGRVKK